MNSQKFYEYVYEHHLENGEFKLPVKFVGNNGILDKPKIKSKYSWVLENNFDDSDQNIEMIMKRKQLLAIGYKAALKSKQAFLQLYLFLLSCILVKKLNVYLLQAISLSSNQAYG